MRGRRTEMPSMNLGNYVTWNIGTATSVYPNNFYQAIYQQVTTATTTVYVNQYPVSYGTVTIGANYYVQPETEEQRLEREQRERDDAAKEKTRRERAKKVLFSTLNREQREEFAAHEYFELQVNGRLYRIRPGARVARLDPETKKDLAYFCIHPALEHSLPSEDVALSQKLLLEANEAEFLRVANKTKAQLDRTACTPDEYRNAQLAEVIDAVAAL
jgi:hypothetical protein